MIPRRSLVVMVAETACHPEHARDLHFRRVAGCQMRIPRKLGMTTFFRGHEEREGRFIFASFAYFAVKTLFLCLHLLDL